MSKPVSVTVQITIQTPESDDMLMTVKHDFASRRSRMALSTKGFGPDAALKAAENALSSALRDVQKALAGQAVQVDEVPIYAPTGRMDA